MKKISIVRGAFANRYELQNYEPLQTQFNLQLIASKKPLTHVNLPTISLWSPHDLPNFPYKKAILNRLLGDQHWLWGLAKAIEGSSIVHVAETYYAYTHQAVQLKKQGKVKTLISTCWETIPHNNESLYLKRLWKKEAHRYIDHFIVPTLRAKQTLIQEGVGEQKISLIRVGVDLDKFHPSKQKTTNKRQLTVTFIGRNVSEKGVDDLKQATASLPNIKLKLVHALPYSKIPPVYQETDIFVLPSRSTPTWEEQYGMVLVEAMASGLPIIATQTGAIPEILGSAGILIPSRSPHLLRQAIQRLQNNPQLRSQLGSQARLRAEKYFDRQKIAKQLANLYNRLI